MKNTAGNNSIQKTTKIPLHLHCLEKICRKPTSQTQLTKAHFPNPTDQSPLPKPNYQQPTLH